MRPNLLLLGVLAATLSGPPAHAQDAATGTAPAAPPAAPAPVKPKPKPAPKKPPAKSATKPAPAKTPPKPPAPAAAPPPPVPMAAPPPPTLPPATVVPTRAMPAPVPAAVVADAAGEATPQKDGLRITFGGGSSDLNPATDAALRGLVRQVPAATSRAANSVFNIVALAPGTEEDPSTPRRLSLSRALAVRSVLINEGIPSERIYVRALGANAQSIGDGPPDRADVTVTTGAPPPAAPAPAPVPAPAAAAPTTGKTP